MRSLIKIFATSFSSTSTHTERAGSKFTSGGRVIFFSISKPVTRWMRSRRDYYVYISLYTRSLFALVRKSSLSILWNARASVLGSFVGAKHTCLKARKLWAQIHFSKAVADPTLSRSDHPRLNGKNEILWRKPWLRSFRTSDAILCVSLWGCFSIKPWISIY